MLIPKQYAFLLRPLSCLYGLGVALRNLAFDWGILKERTYPIPIICVGNISVGGTGKTPHIEYILSLLYGTCRIAVLSRGYKRHSQGQVIARQGSTVSEIGDEPKQILLKYPKLCMVIDANRRRAMEYLLSLPPSERPELVLMDDGLQHRYVKPSCRIMLIDAGRPIDEDRLLPAGTLREPSSARYRMDCIIVTKCPTSLKAMELRGIERSLAAYPYQPVFFSSMQYADLLPIEHLLGAVEEGAKAIPTATPLMLVSGIAQPQSFCEALKDSYQIVEVLSYADHHHFTAKDLQHIGERFAQLLRAYPELRLVCTEKDAVRLIEHIAELPPCLERKIYYLPMQVKFLQCEERFRRFIIHNTRVKPQALQDL